MRPRLKPALRRVWRDHQTLQIGLDPDNAVVVTGLDPALRKIVDNLTGRRTEEALLAQARAHGVTDTRARRLLRILADAGALDDGDVDGTVLCGLEPTERQRLMPDLAARSLVSKSPDGGTGTLARRRRARLAVHGAGRIGASIATLLGAAGVGTVLVADPTKTRPGDLAPAGLGPVDVGRPRAAGVRRAVTAFTSSTTVSVVGESTPLRPHVAVLAPDDEPDRMLADALVRAGIPHLVVRMRDARAIVGPFVLPGKSSCVRCHDMHRAARDPAWPRVLAQLLGAPHHAPACDVVLATMTAAYASLHVLAFLDGMRPPSVDATLEIDLPFGSVRRRTWSAHPACGCQWDPEPRPSAIAA
ncbi:ThiF family adenylyltransferase [Thermasporomyces composti]|uniref:Bacteriocin biosynthesis cyclodehydratase domain-containing protein n=1 Tax=Thermasporomyces composti TaxID=696763 RepID=A0A3D9V1V9_THECX|nr:ThiF family adenylyltransferase [Thermasporomyces composti]REF35507.1 bacteriocin biosynthesis cyclodehydratase domain-containing protein [Thermasporomyces composti]